MILAYHKVHPRPKTHFWVSVDAFDRQLAALQAFEVVTLDEYDPANERHAAITFDGVYENVHDYAFPILLKWGYPFELFVIGDHIGRGNEFDQRVEPPARFASVEQLERMAAGGGRVQWHTRSHGRLADLTAEEVARELTVPAKLRERFAADGHLTWFAYPHGEHSEPVARAVEERFTGALSVIQGRPGDRYALERIEVAEETRLPGASTMSVIIPNYNYGAYLPEAIDSVLRQTHPPDELLVIDDCSTDDSSEVLSWYRDDDRVRIERNARNLGIVQNFRRAVELTSGDYVVFVGADNRARSDLVERGKAALDANPEAPLAYSDMVIFGQRSAVLAEAVGAEPTAAEDVFLWRFPEPTPDRVARLDRENFVHGSAIYRRSAYEAAGGYRRTDAAEDHDLFQRMLLQAGGSAVHIAAPLIEYRQHSGEQANTLLRVQIEAAYHRCQAQAQERRANQADAAGAELGRQAAELHEQLRRLQAQNARLTAELQRVYGGGWWQLRKVACAALAAGRRLRSALRRAALPPDSALGRAALRVRAMLRR